MADIEGRGKLTDDIGDTFAYNTRGEAEIKIRLGFIRKVYGLLLASIFVTVAVGIPVGISETTLKVLDQESWVVLPILISYMVLYMALIACRRSYPVNLIILFSFTVVQGLMLGTIVSVTDKMVVLQAIGVTVSVVLALTIFTFQTKYDFSVLGGMLFCALWVLIIMGLMQIFLPLNDTVDLAIAIGGAIVFSLFIVYDTHKLLKSEELSPEDYIIGTICLYMDIINLFLYILRIVRYLK